MIFAHSPYKGQEQTIISNMTRILIALSLVLALPPVFGQTVITVGDVDGGDTDCDFKYQSLQQAIDQVAGMGPGDEVTIRLAVPGGFGTLEKTIDSLERDLVFQGGYEACDSESPTVGGYTEIRLPIQSGNRLFELDLTGQVNRQTITFDHVILDGQENDNGVTDGGLIRALGPVNLVLHSSILRGGRVSVIDSGSARGGAIFLGDKALLETVRRTELENNQADLGGAVYCDSTAEIILGSTRLSGNAASWGGAIALGSDCNRLVFTSNASPWRPRNRLSGNQAMEGGAIYSAGTDIVTSDVETLPDLFLSISGNEAMAGGAITVYGDHADPATLDLGNVVFSGNSADYIGGALYLNGGIDAHIRQVGNAPLCPGQAAKSCTSLRRNFAGDQGDMGGAGLAFLGNGSDGLPRLRIERAELEDNYTDGTTAVVHLEPDSSLVIHNSLINDRLAGGGDFLFTANQADELVVMYNTIADTNDVKGILAEGDMTAYITGSIYWNGDRPLWTNPDGQATVLHADCLLTSTMVNLPGSGSIVTDDPQFDADYRLEEGSPAINICDDLHQNQLPAGAMNVDFKFEPRGYMTPEHASVWGPYDLGALAHYVDELFQDRFENP